MQIRILSFTIASILLASFPFQPTLDAQSDQEVFGQPDVTEVRASKWVSRLMEKDHLSKRKIDDTIARRAFDIYTRALDPMKIYFLNSDIEEFRTLETVSYTHLTLPTILLV